MPTNPFPITLTVYENDNTTLSAAARCYVRNVTKRTESTEEITNSNGQVIISLLNLPIASGQTVTYEAGDKILLVAYKGHDHDAYLFTVTGSSYDKTLYLNPVRHYKDLAVEKIKCVVVANTSSTVYAAKFYSRNNGKLISYVQCPANNTIAFNTEAMSADGGVVVERTNYQLVVTVVTK